MITNQVMKRPMGNFLVEQRTKDSMFNATNLLKQWNEASGEKKEITKFFDNDNTKEFISALMEEENLHTQKSAYVKSNARSDRGGGTWMHPILFVKFAMWLNPRFEVQVIKFVYDQMLKYRNDAGDAYKELGTAIGKIVSKKFMPTSTSQERREIIRLVQDGAITISSFRIGECTSNSMGHHTTRKSKRLSILKKTASYARSSDLSVESVMITSWTR